MADELQNGATEIDRRMWDVNTQLITTRYGKFNVKKRSKVKEIIVLIKARSFPDELNLEHLTS